ncbi:protein of unknown function DUF1833 [Vibrio phage 1.076.O._10N.286.51.B7]|nr:protein of unknown function DUF1833 [Vibrio phage 1.076.O._10N.286.51.B7]
MTTPEARRFFTTKPREIYFETFEIYHPQGINRRLVARQFVPKMFGIESTASRNAGQMVEFEPAAMEITPVQQSNQTTVSLELQLGRVGSMFKSELEKINGSGFLTPIEGIYRVYRGSVLNEPMMTPITLFCSSATLENESVGLLFEDDNPASVTVSELYLPQDFAGLEVQLG